MSNKSDNSNMRLVQRGRQALSDKQERNLVVGGTYVLNEDWEEARLFKNSRGELVIVEVNFNEKMRA